MKTYLKHHWKLLLGIGLIILFLIIRITLVYTGGPHDVWTELISSFSFLTGFLSGCLIVNPPSKSKLIDKNIQELTTKYNNLLELQNDEYNFGHNVNHDVDKYVE